MVLIRGIDHESAILSLDLVHRSSRFTDYVFPSETRGFRNRPIAEVFCMHATMYSSMHPILMGFPHPISSVDTPCLGRRRIWCALRWLHYMSSREILLSLMNVFRLTQQPPHFVALPCYLISNQVHTRRGASSYDTHQNHAPLPVSWSLPHSLIRVRWAWETVLLPTQVLSDAVTFAALNSVFLVY
jgi:hypothetical protein